MHAVWVTILIVLVCAGDRPAVDGRQVAATAAAEQRATEGLLLEGTTVIAVPARRTRTLVAVDPIESMLAAGRMVPAAAGTPLALPGGGEARWERAGFAADHSLRHAALAGGYAAATVRSDRARVALLQASGHHYAIVNGRTLAGDPYGHGYVVVPVKLKAGDNAILFRCSRGYLKAELLEPLAPLALITADATLPDVVDGEGGRLSASIGVVGAFDEWVRDGVITATLLRDGVEVGAAVASPLPPLPPLTSGKSNFAFDAPSTGLDRGSPDPSGSAPTAASGRLEGNWSLRVAIGQAGQEPRHEAAIPIRLRRPGESHRRTFVSGIDGSVQYYAVVPRAAEAGNANAPALFLSLHGASVEAQSQAQAYAARDWGVLVAPTNRRPYGFDWEDWGRLDALEVLHEAVARFAPDPARIYLTGHSMGGHGTWQIGAHYPDRFAAIAPSAGWISFQSYGGRRGGDTDASPEGAAALLDRAASPSDTAALSQNYLHHGVYVLHGDADDNVPVSEARAMRAVLGGMHPNFAYYERPGAGHWWGNECVDWPPLFEFLRNNARPATHAVDKVDFATSHPSVSDSCHWIAVEQQREWLRPSRVTLSLDRGERRLTGDTQNVRALIFDAAAAFGSAFDPAMGLSVRLDGQNAIPVDAGDWHGGRVRLLHEAGTWRVAPAVPSEKNPRRAGPFKEAFRNRVVLVVGTGGTAEENAWAMNKACFDRESFWYRGNGQLEIVLDVDIDAPEYRDRNVVLYGSADTNRAWASALAADCTLLVDRRGVTVGPRRVAGTNLGVLAIYPRRGSDTASVGIIAGTGLEGCRTLDRLPIFLSGVGIPDWVVVSSEIHTRGIDGIVAAGFFDHAWKHDASQSAGRD